MSKTDGLRKRIQWRVRFGSFLTFTVWNKAKRIKQIWKDWKLSQFFLIWPNTWKKSKILKFENFLNETLMEWYLENSVRNFFLFINQMILYINFLNCKRKYIMWSYWYFGIKNCMWLYHFIIIFCSRKLNFFPFYDIFHFKILFQAFDVLDHCHLIFHFSIAS